MIIGAHGVTISGAYKGVSPGLEVTQFTDGCGAQINIDTTTLVYLYELVKFDLEKRTGKTMDELFPPITK